MKPMTKPMTLLWVSCLTAAMLLGPAAEGAAADDPPQTTQDGLVLKSNSKTRLVYVKPGATLSQYDKIAILDCYVEFEKDWQKDYNASRVGLEGRVSDQDVARMKTGLAGVESGSTAK